MLTENIKINNIPAILWGETSPKIMIAVHGNLSSKSDTPIAILAEEAVPHGFQVLSFDLPEHGDRKKEPTLCKVQACVADLKEIMKFARGRAASVSLMANSMGAYFSMLAYQDEAIEQSLFLSPVVDMERIIDNMMQWFGISVERLAKENEILTPIGQTIYWDYYQYIKENPIRQWPIPTAILYGQEDEICEYKYIAEFVEKFNCKLAVSSTSKHYFHTTEDLAMYRKWLQANIILAHKK